MRLENEMRRSVDSCRSETPNVNLVHVYQIWKSANEFVLKRFDVNVVRYGL
jgi:hypothetical protein